MILIYRYRIKDRSAKKTLRRHAMTQDHDPAGGNRINTQRSTDTRAA